MVTTDEIRRLVGPPLEVTEALLEACQKRGRFGGLVFELYKESGRLVCVSSSVYFARPGETIKYDRNEAICAGLLVRVSKLMLSVVKLSADIEHGETVQALNRCIIESAVDVQYLIFKDDEKVFDDFVKVSLVAERELYDLVHDNVKARDGERLIIEEGMLKSIEDTLEHSGITLEQIDMKGRSWGGSFRNKLNALGYDGTAYTILMRIPSHAVHGDWVDLVKNHLRPMKEGFEINSDHLTTDGELLGPIAVFAIEATRAYLDKYVGRYRAEPLFQRFDSLQERLLRVEEARGDLQIGR